MIKCRQEPEDKVESIVPESQMYSTEHVPKSDTEWLNIAPLTLYSGNLGGVQKRLGVSHGESSLDFALLRRWMGNRHAPCMPCSGRSLATHAVFCYTLSDE